MPVIPNPDAGVLPATKPYEAAPQPPRPQPTFVAAPTHSEAVLQELRSLAQANGLIPAIKRYRELFALGLKDAKENVEAIVRGETPPHAIPAPPMPELQLEAFREPAQAPAFDPSDPDEELRDLLRRGQKIEAIKRKREQSGLGLREAKDYVEALQF